MNFEILYSTQSDLDEICRMFDKAVAYQKSKGYPVYKNKDRAGVEMCIKNKLHLKIVENNAIACSFSIAYSDPDIWREKDQEPAIYLHRIITDQKYKGQKLFTLVLEWTKRLAMKNNISKIRLDTWNFNPPLVEYYQSFGFEIVEYFNMPDEARFPSNCRGNDLVLMEYSI